MQNMEPNDDNNKPYFPVSLTLDECVKCNICTTACPVSPVTDLFPGPKYEGPQGERFRSFGQLSPDLSVDYCSGCRVCNMVCPAGVKIAEMNARARAVMVEQGRFPWRSRLRNNIIARAALVGQLARPVAPLGNWVLNLKPARWLAEKTLRIHRQAPFPAFSGQSFRAWFAKQPAVEGAVREVAYFHGCSTEFYEPRVGRAAVRVLEANRIQTVLPRQNCCGLPLLSNGEFSAARRYHQGNVSSLSEYARRGLPIVGTSTSCTLTLKEEAPELLDMHDPDSRLVAEHTYDLNEFLLDLLAEGQLNTSLRPLPLTLAYHIPCQYRAHRLGHPGTEILSLVPELRLVESGAACCGIAGTYGYKEEKYEIAMKVGGPLFDFVSQMKPPLVVCDSETCRWQITHATGVPSIHPVEILAWAYGYPPEGPLKDVLERQP
jgi:glycerol-3-phosphate dehydrogenase subunit C